LIVFRANNVVEAVLIGKRRSKRDTAPIVWWSNHSRKWAKQ